MLDILAITAPIFLLIGIGYLSVHARLIEKPQIRGIGVFVIHCALPALIIRALVSRPLSETFSPVYLLAYGLASAVLFAGALAVALCVQRKALDLSALYALGMSASNSGFVGYPLVVLLLGAPAAVALAMNMLIENMLLIPAALALAEASSQRGGAIRTTLMNSARQLARNPIIVAICFGTVIAVSGISLPRPVFRVIDMLAEAAAPTALFVIGGTLYGLKTRGMAANVAQIALGKLILHPLLVLLALLVLPPLDPALATAAVLFACAPMLSVYPIFGQRYGLGEITAAALMATTLLSFFTISLFIWLMNVSGLFALP